MMPKALDVQGDVIPEETCCSIGGGFVLSAGEIAEAGADVPHPWA